MARYIKAPVCLTSTKGRPSCPEHLSAEAQREFIRVCDELESMGTLSTADRGTIALYATAWARWVKAEKDLASSGIIVESSKTKVPMHSLWLTVSNQSQKQMYELAKELGLTPRSRRLMGETTEPEETEKDFSDLER